MALRARRRRDRAAVSTLLAIAATALIAGAATAYKSPVPSRVRSPPTSVHEALNWMVHNPVRELKLIPLKLLAR